MIDEFVVRRDAAGTVCVFLCQRELKASSMQGAATEHKVPLSIHK